MNKTKRAHCGVCDHPTFERNNYFYGKEMHPRDFRLEQEYFNEKRWLLNRAIHGWGVICGLPVEWDPERSQLRIGEGLALDCCGREILVCDEICVPLEELDRHCGELHTESERLVVCLEFEECKTEPVSDPLGDECGAPEKTRYNHIRDAYRVRVYREDELCIDEKRGRICYLDAIKGPRGEGQVCATQPWHQFMCEASGTCPECQSCECLVLATLTVRRNDAEPDHSQGKSLKPEGTEEGGRDVLVDSCTHRRLVYPNPVLHDLIQCFHGDMPHIVDTSWHTFSEQSQRTLPFDHFAGLIATDGIRVTFDHPIRDETLNENTFFVTVFVEESGTGHLAPKRIPCREIRYEVRDGCPMAWFIPDDAWVNDELNSRHSELADGLQVEITLRGSLIEGATHLRAQAGKALDGDFIGGRFPTGNGVQGGDFIDYFHVEPRDRDPRRRSRRRDDDEGELLEDF